MQLVILAGGLGTRLKQKVYDRPKSMALINSRPFLEYQIKWAKSQGITDVVLCVGYMSDSIKNYFGKGEKLGISIQYAEEKELLGTAGALKNAEELLNDQFILINGDTFRDVSLNQLFSFHIEKCSALTLSLAHVESMMDFGGIKLDRDYRITRFTEKGIKGPGLINGGIYTVNKEVLKYIPASTKFSLELELIPKLLSSGICIFGLPQQGIFIDIGTPVNYEKAQEVLKKYDY